MSSWFGFSSASASKADDTESESSDIDRRGVGAAFTSTKCPNGPGLENSCELPFGFVWTPMADPGDDISEDDPNGLQIIKCESNEFPPVLCLSCLAYINPHVQINKKGIWKCALCEHENVVPKDQLRKGTNLMTALTSPCVEYHQRVAKPVPSEKEKIDYATKNEDCCTFIFVVDENLSPKDGQAIIPAVEAMLKDRAESEDGEDTKIGLVVFGKSVSIYQLGISGLASADVYAGPDDIEGDDDEFDREVEKRSYIADVHSGELTSLRNALSSVFGVAVDDPLAASSSLFSGGSRMEMLSRRKAARLRKEENGTDQESGVAAKSPWIRSSNDSSSSRCTGNAIQCALDLASSSSSSSRTSRIVLFTNGFPNIGEGSVVDHEASMEKSKSKRGKKAPHDIVDADMLEKAVTFFDTLASAAIDVGIGLDVFCCGVTELALPVYQAMVEPGMGYVMPLITLDTPELEQNLKFILDNTYMSRSRYLPEGANGSGAECIVDIRSDSFVTPAQFCGSGTVVANTSLVENEQGMYEEGSKLALEKGFKVKNLPSEKALELSMTRIQLGRVDPLNTMTVMLEIDESIEEDDEYAFFQVVSRYLSRRGDFEITRVCSIKMEIAKDINDFLESVDDEVTSVVLGKVAVYRSLYGREETDSIRDVTTAIDANAQEKLAFDTQTDLDATVQRISGAFRLLDLGKSKSKTGSSPSSFDFAFPPQLKGTLNRLYHLRRGHLISPGPMQSIDDRAGSRKFFIRFPLEVCLKMIRPSLWSTGSIGISSGWDSMIPFPAETLALWDDSIIAADFHDSLFIWSGVNCTATRYDGIRQKFKAHLLEISRDRFPMPVLHELNDGDSMCRRFTSRLAPSHADPIDNQIVHFPLLSTLKAHALNDLRSKFKFYDAKSDESFRSWFLDVSSASNNSRMEGMSLSE